MSMIGPDAGRHLTHDELVLHHFNEDDGQARAHVEAHLRTCEACRNERECLAELLALVEAHADVAAPPGFERVMWARLEPHIAAPPAVPWWQRPWSLWPAVPAAAVLVLLAFVAGRWTGGPAAPDAPPAQHVEVAATDRVLVDAAGEHLERTQAVLVELLNTEMSGPLPDAERARAADLLAASRLIRQSADKSGESALADVLDELERVLLAMANDGDGWSRGDRDVLKARIESRDLLFRTRVLGSEMRARVARWD